MSTAASPLQPGWAKLAAELAMRLEPPLVVARRHGLDRDGLKALLQDERFSATVREAADRFGAIHNTATRIKYKGELAVEAGIETLFSIMSDVNSPASARVQAFTALKSLTNLGQPEPSAQGFTLKIVLPEGQSPVVIEAAPAPTEPDSVAEPAIVEEASP